MTYGFIDRPRLRIPIQCRCNVQRNAALSARAKPPTACPCGPFVQLRVQTDENGRYRHPRTSPSADAFLQAPQLSWMACPPKPQPTARRRRALVRTAKYVLPVVALVVALQHRHVARNRPQHRKQPRHLASARPDQIGAAGQMVNLRYHGMDGRNRPYTVLRRRRRARRAPSASTWWPPSAT